MERIYSNIVKKGRKTITLINNAEKYKGKIRDKSNTPQKRITVIKIIEFITK